MKALLSPAVWIFAAVAACASGDPLAESRAAWERGLPTIAAAKLEAVNPANLDAAGRQERATLLARSLLATGQAAAAAQSIQDAAAIEEPGSGTPEPSATTPQAPIPPALRFWLAEAEAALGRYQEALAHYRASPPEFFPDARLGEARMLDALGHRSEALEVLDQAGAGNAVAVERARLLLAADHPQEAFTVLEGLGELPAALFLRAKALVRLDRLDEALKTLEKIRHPDAALAVARERLRAETLVAAGRREDAEDTVEKFMEEHPTYSESLFPTLDAIYAAESAPSSSDLRRWADDSAHPLRAALALYYLGINEQRLGREDRASSAWTDFLTRHPNHALADSVSVRLAEISLTQKSPARALEILEGHPGGRADFMRGLALAALNRYPEAGQAFQSSADATGWESARFNAALCAALDGREFSEQGLLPGRADDLRLAAALAQAERGEPGAAEHLRQLATRSAGPRSERAGLAAAEWDYLHGNPESARRELMRVSSSDPALAERKAALDVFLQDDGTADAEPSLISAATTFLDTHPSGALAQAVRLKRGEIYFRRGNYAAARVDFEAVAEGGGPLSEKALFLAGQSAARSLSKIGNEEALDHFEDVARREGPLALRARLAQALLLNALGRHHEALPVLDKIIASHPEEEIKFAALIEKGDTWFQMGKDDPAAYGEAIAAWRLATEPGTPARWRNQAFVKIGAASEQRGEIPAALSSYNDALTISDSGGDDSFWFYKAGFDAARLLESQGRVGEAVRIYEVLAAREGARSEEARQRLNALRLENFLWDEKPPAPPPIPSSGG